MPVKKSSSKPVQPILPLEAYALTDLDNERFTAEAGLGMVPPDDPVLSRAALAVDVAAISSEQVQQLVIRLFETATGQKRADGKGTSKRTLVGLAAPQIGEAVRMVIIDTKITRERKGISRLECFINPEIIWRSVEEEEGHEGCFSTGPVWGLVKRPLAVKIRAYTPLGTPVERTFEGFTARITLHELDHLDGIRFPDRIKNNKKRHWVHSEELLAYRADPKGWRRLCNRERWEAFKQGRITSDCSE